MKIGKVKNNRAAGITRHSTRIGMAVALAGLTGFAQADTFNGKTSAMSGAGVATANYIEGVSINPASLANFEQNRRQRFSLQLNLGALGSDQDELIDSASDLANLLDALDGQVLVPELGDQLIQRFEEVDRKRATLGFGGGAYMTVPTRTVSVGLYASAEAGLAVTASVDEGDLTLLRELSDLAGLSLSYDGSNLDAIISQLEGEERPHFLANGGTLDVNDLESTILATGAGVINYGVVLARRVDDTSYGLIIKHQQVEIIEYLASVASFDEDDFDAGDYRTSGSGLNFDLGMQHQFGSWYAGAAVNNAIKRSYTSATGRSVTIKPRLVVGSGYRNSWFTGALDLDANATPTLATGADSQFARLGLQFDAWNWAQLRLGYKTDLRSQIDDTVSAGIGLSPFGAVYLDASAIVGRNDTVGFTLQAGVAF